MFQRGGVRGKVNDGFGKLSFILTCLLKDFIMQLASAQEDHSTTCEKFRSLANM